jgi:hypothetical protein
MNVEIGAEAALFPEKEYINGIAVAVYNSSYLKANSIVSNPILTTIGKGRSWEDLSYRMSTFVSVS